MPKRSVIATAEIDGTEHRLAYDFNMIADVEAESGGNLLAGLMDLANLNAAQLRGLLCAAMRAAEPNPKKRKLITVQRAAALIKYDTMFPFCELLSNSILLSIPKQVESAPPPAPDEKADEPADDPTKDPECL